MQVRSNSISQWKTGKSLFSTGDHLHFRTILFTFIPLKDRTRLMELLCTEKRVEQEVKIWS